MWLVKTMRFAGFDARSVSQPFASSESTTGFGWSTSKNTAAWTSIAMSTMRGSSAVR
jgi:hypothetical protein